MKSTFYEIGGINLMTLKKYLLDQNIDQIEDDEEFCRVEYETIRDYCSSHTLTEDDVQEIESRGYHKEDLLSL